MKIGLPAGDRAKLWFHLHIPHNLELIKKTTILFPPELHQQLARLAKQRDTSLGELVRNACRLQYGFATRETRLAAVQELSSMALPVGTPQEMERESVPSVEPLT